MLMKINVKTATVGKGMSKAPKGSTIVASRASRVLDAILEGFRHCGIPLKLVGHIPNPLTIFAKSAAHQWCLLELGTKLDPSCV